MLLLIPCCCSNRVIWIWVIVPYAWQWVEDKTVICFSFWLLLLGETVTDHLFPTSCPPRHLPDLPQHVHEPLWFPSSLFLQKVPFFCCFFSTPSQQKRIHKSIFSFSITLVISLFVSFNLCFPSNVPISFSLSFLLQTSLTLFFFIFCHSMLIWHTRLESFGFISNIHVSKSP